MPNTVTTVDGKADAKGDAKTRLVAAAIARGVRAGVGALSIQGIAEEAGLSKALVLYHYDDKVALLEAVLRELVGGEIAAIEAAADAADAFDGWRKLASDTHVNARRALLNALYGEEALRAQASEQRGPRRAAATRLANAMLAGVGVRARVAPALLGELVLTQLDGLAAATSDKSEASATREGALDAFALALLSLGE